LIQPVQPFRETLGAQGETQPHVISPSKTGPGYQCQQGLLKSPLGDAHVTPSLATDSPAEVGPVMFSNSSPSYALLRPVGSGAADEGSTNWPLIGGIAAVVILGGALIGSRRRSTADERE